MSRFCSLATVVANDLVDFYDDVLGDAGLYGITINHLDKRDALFVALLSRTLLLF